MKKEPAGGCQILWPVLFVENLVHQLVSLTFSVWIPFSGFLY